MLRWIDTHNHLFVLRRTAEKSFGGPQSRRRLFFGACAGGVNNLEDARRCAYEYDQAYACGIHPLYIRSSWKEDLTAMEAFLEEHHRDDLSFSCGGRVRSGFFCCLQRSA